MLKNVLRYFMGSLDARSLKEVLLSSSLMDLPVADVKRMNSLFCTIVKLLVRGELIHDLLKLKREGYTIVLLSASPDLYLKDLRGVIGFDFLISTQVEIIDDRVTGKIIGENCKGTEKVRRLREVFTQEEIGNAICYADSQSDTPLMEIVRKPIWI